MNEEFTRAMIFYDNLLNEYSAWQKGGVGDKKSKERMINAACGLAKLKLENPFREKTMLKTNANKIPRDGKMITGAQEVTGGKE